MRTFNVVSNCCRSTIDQGIRREYPLGGSTYGINYKIDVCSECGQEVEHLLEECGICGEVGCEGDCEENEINELSNYSCW